MTFMLYYLTAEGFYEIHKDLSIANNDAYLARAFFILHSDDFWIIFVDTYKIQDDLMVLNLQLS